MRLFGLLLACSLTVPALAAPALQAQLRKTTTVLVLGDSLSAAYNLLPEQGWVSLLEQTLAGNYPSVRIVNASSSGETTSGGRVRLPTLLTQHQPAIVVIELGANDGLRGYPIKSFSANLEFMIRESQARGADVLLIGMRIPPNYGLRYTREFHGTYSSLAERYQTALMPFLLDGVAGHDALMQEDGLHPSAEAQPIILDRVLPYLLPLIERREGRHAQLNR